MSIRRKMNRKGATKPPLSFVDKLIYCILLLFGFSFVFLMLLYVSVAESIGHADTDVIASSNLAAALWAIPLSLGLPMSISIPIVYALKNKQPIFGNKKFKPHPFVPTIKTYPVFSKEFKDNLSPKTKAKAKIIAIIVAISLAFCLSISFLGIYPRHSLHNDGSLVSYNFLNHPKNEYKLEEIKQLKIGISRSSIRSTRKFYINIELVFDDASYAFSEGDFSRMRFSNRNDAEILEGMLLIKGLVGEDKCDIDSSRLDELLTTKGYSPAEESLARKLFRSSQ